MGNYTYVYHIGYSNIQWGCIKADVQQSHMGLAVRCFEPTVRSFRSEVI